MSFSLDDLSQQICKEFGENVMVDASAILAEDYQVIPCDFSLDLAFGGGIPEGSWANFTGPPKMGKTTTILSFAANAQKPEWGSRPVVLLDAEARFKQKNINYIHGLDISPDKFRVIHNTEDKILSSQDYLKIGTMILKDVPKVILIIDSWSALCDEKVFAEGIGTETRSSGYKNVAQFVGINAGVVRVNKSIVLGVTHQIANTSGYGSPTSEKVANALKYQVDTKVKIKSTEPLMVGGKTGRRIGTKINWIVEVSPFGVPGTECSSYLRYGYGLDSVYAMMDYGESIGLITKSGAWYLFDFLEKRVDKWNKETMKQYKAMGAENAYQLLASHPDWCKWLGDDIKQYLAGTA